MLDGLNMPDLGILFDLNPDEHLPSAQVENTLALPDLNAYTPELNPLLYLGTDSSGTDAPARDTGTMGSRLKQRDQQPAWDRMRLMHWGGSGEARQTSCA